MNRFPVSSLLVLLCCVCASSSFADIIYKKNGEHIEGKVVVHGADKLFIEQSGGKVITVLLEEIERIEETSAEVDPAAKNVLDRTKQFQEEGQHREAVRWIIEQTGGKPQQKKDIAPLFAKSLDALFVMVRDLLNRGNPQNAREILQELQQCIVRDASDNADLFGSLENWNRSRKDLFNCLADCNIALAQQTWKQDTKLATSYLDEITLPQNGEDPILPENDPNLERQIQLKLLRGGILEREGKEKEALQLYQHFQQRNLANTQIRASDSYKELNQRINLLNKRFATPAPTALSTPDPVKVEEARVREQEIERRKVEQEERVKRLEEQKALAERPLGQKFKDFTGEMATAQFWQKFWSDLLQGVYLMPILFLLGAVLILWWLPRNITLFMLRRGIDEAGLWYSAVRKYGIFAFAGLIGVLTWQVIHEWIARAKGVKTQKQSRPRCPNCRKYLDNIEAYREMNFVVCPHCRENITPVYQIRDYLVHLIEQVELTMMDRRQGGHSNQQFERDAMMKLVQVMFTVAVRERATDLHVSAEEDGMAVRVRVDGTLRILAVIPKSIGPAISSALMVMANLDITERQVPQDGRISVKTDESNIDVRINSSPNPHGDNISMRLLDNRRIQLGTQQLGLEGPGRVTFEKVINSPHGLILVTGPTGSGKSTTLYVALNMMNTGDRNIITIEDPIEYKVKGLNQQQVNVARNFTFATGLRSILRQDPDVIMVGEVRDRETAEISIEASLTGHLVLTTLHTIDAPSAVSRLRDLGIEPRRYAPALSLVLAQRLVRLICKACREEYRIEMEYLKILGLEPQPGQKFFHGAGCTQCAGTGYYGRQGIFEVLTPKDEMRNLLESQFTTSQIRDWARNNGMRTLREMGIEKIVRQLTTADEVIRVTS